MAILIKCKICGDTEFTEAGELLQCRSCKHKTPKPKENAELLERANNLRFETKSFDEAATLYEKIFVLPPMKPRLIGAEYFAATVLNI